MLIQFLRALLGAVPDQQTSAVSTDPSDLKATEGHARFGYENIQAVIRFLDQKAGTIIGLSTLFGGFVVVSGKWLFEMEISDGVSLFEALLTQHRTTFAVTGVSFCVSVLLCMSTVWAGLRCFRPRGPSGDFRTTVLFPLHDPTNAEARTATNLYLSRLRKGMPMDMILEEYQNQLLQVSGIAYLKMGTLRVAERLFLAQVITAAIMWSAVLLKLVFLTKAA